MTPLDKVKRFIKEGRLGMAHKSVRAILEREPQNAEAKFYLGVIFEEQGRYREALNLYLDVKRHREWTKAENINLNIGAMYDRLGKRKLATKYYIRELDSHPESPQAHFNLGFIYFDSFRYEKALPLLEYCYRIQYYLKDVYPALAKCYWKLGRYEAESRLHVLRLRATPRDLFARQNYGGCLIDLKKYREALDILEKIPVGQRKSYTTRNIKRARKLMGGSRRQVRSRRKLLPLKSNPSWKTEFRS